MAAESDPRAGTPQRTVAGRYHLQRPLGRGGMGTVWLAHDGVLDRPVAVKEVTYPGVVSAEERALLEERTMREARAAARLSSPRTTTVHDVVAEDGRPWIVMEYVESRTLGDVLAESGPLHPMDVAGIGLDVLDALEAAHSMNVVHRDVKPANVLLDASGRAWLTDFGIATSSDQDTLSEQGVLLGSPSFMAPERARGDEAGPFTDLWSLGATLYAAVEGRGPFDRGEAMATLLAVTTDPPGTPRHAGPLAPVLISLLAKEPEKRMTGWQARAALRRIVDETSGSMPPTTSVAPASPPLHSAPPASAPTSAPPPGQPAPGTAPPAGPAQDLPPQAPGRVRDSVARIDRQDVARLASLAGRSLAKGAARAAVAGLNAWQEQAATSGSPPSRPVQPERPAPEKRPARKQRSRQERRADRQSVAEVLTGRRHPLRLPMMVLSLIAVGLLLGVALIVVLAVLAVH